MARNRHSDPALTEIDSLMRRQGYLPVVEAAGTYGIGKSTLYQRMADKAIRGRDIDGNKYVLEADMPALRDSMRAAKKPSPEASPSDDQKREGVALTTVARAVETVLTSGALRPAIDVALAEAFRSDQFKLLLRDTISQVLAMPPPKSGS